MAATLLLNLPRPPTCQLKHHQIRSADDCQELFNCITSIWKRMPASRILGEHWLKRFLVLDFSKSTQPLMASFQGWMIDNVVVPVATTYDLEEYKNLKISINEFLTGRELEKLPPEAGFADSRHYEVSGGLMGNLVATR